MSAVILYIFMATAGGNGYVYRSWTEQGVYKTMEACEKAIIRLNITETGRCVPTV